MLDYVQEHVFPLKNVIQLGFLLKNMFACPSGPRMVWVFKSLAIGAFRQYLVESTAIWANIKELFNAC
jgi:hypothetical protein